MTREEAIEVYNGLINTKIKEAFEFFSPELRESEDERIRTFLIELVIRTWSFEFPSNISRIDVLAYLEKQKEQKPAEWSEEKEKTIDDYATEIIKWEDNHKDWDREVIRATAYHFFNYGLYNFLNSQPKQEWSEEDESSIELIRMLILSARNVQSNSSLWKQYDDALAWLDEQKDKNCKMRLTKSESYDHSR